MKGRTATSAEIRRVLSCSRRPDLWPKLTGFQNRFSLHKDAHALFLLFAENLHFAMKSAVSMRQDQNIKEITSLQKKLIVTFLIEKTKHLRSFRRATANLRSSNGPSACFEARKSNDYKPNYRQYHSRKIKGISLIRIFQVISLCLSL